MKLRLDKVNFSVQRSAEFGQAKVNGVFLCLSWDVSRGRRAQSQPEGPCCLQKNDAEEVLGVRLQVWCVGKTGSVLARCCPRVHEVCH